VGNLYANVSKSFKTPTLDQLYDQRAIPIPFPPFQISLSSSELKPQRGSGFEVGMYHRTELVPGQLTGELTVAVYQMDMRNELDFSLETLTYTNLGKSRHRGLETGLKLYGPKGVSAFLNYTYQGVTLEFGDNQGNYVKAIPRDVITTGVSAVHRSGLGGSLRLKAADRIFLDDANTIPLDGYTTVDARVSYQIRDYTVALNVFNLFDKAYSSTGFPLDDFTGGQELFLYPAAGRQLQLGLTVDL
jgi:outer membrane receptor protein involved in Fe transport